MKDTFSYNSTEIWRTIPFRIRNCLSVTAFKNKYKELLLQIQNNQVIHQLLLHTYQKSAVSIILFISMLNYELYTFLFEFVWVNECMYS